jgi:hypothetical protein
VIEWRRRRRERKVNGRRRSIGRMLDLRLQLDLQLRLSTIYVCRRKLGIVM